MTTLVTGAGLIGASFAQQAVKRDEKVVFLDPIPRQDFLKSKLGDAPFVQVQADVRSLASLLDAIREHKVETILNTASLIGHRAANPIHEGFSLNVVGTQTVAEAARIAGIRRIVHISTFGAYDWRRPTPEPITEDFPRGSGVPYGNFKAVQELVLEAYRAVYQFELIVLRPANVYGVGHFWGGSGGGEKVQDLVLAGISGQTARIPEDQTMAFEYVYAKDIGRAVDLACTKPMPEKNVFNIGNGATTTFDQLVATVQKLLPGLKVEIVPGAKPVSRNQHLDHSQARELLGWQPEFTMEEGFADYIEDLRAEMGRN